MLVDVVGLVGRREDLGLVDVVDLERFENLGLGEVPNPRLRHHRDRHRLLNLLDDAGACHPRDTARGADVGRHALQRHYGHGAGVLGDLRLLGRGHVHDHAALEHLGETGLDSECRTLGHYEPHSRRRPLSAPAIADESRLPCLTDWRVGNLAVLVSWGGRVRRRWRQKLEYRRHNPWGPLPRTPVSAAGPDRPPGLWPL